MDNSFLLFFHSLLRYLVLITIVVAAVVSWRGWLMQTPIMVWERLVTIAAMILCHVQLVIGSLLYVVNFKAMKYTYAGFKDLLRYWKYEHAGLMILAIALITAGRLLSKRAHDEPRKQQYIAVFYTLGLLVILWAIPWPFTFFGAGRGWL